jgi:hypothetical protein
VFSYSNVFSYYTVQHMNLRHLPVVDHGNRPVGMQDILKSPLDSDFIYSKYIRALTFQNFFVRLCRDNLTDALLKKTTNAYLKTTDINIPRPRNMDSPEQGQGKPSCRATARMLSRVLYIVASHSKYTKALTSQNLCQARILSKVLCLSLTTQKSSI